MIKKLPLLLVGVLAVLLAGCASGARPEEMVPTGVTAAAPDNQYYGHIKVGAVTGGEETNPLWTSEVSSEAFRHALSSALTDAKLKGPGSLVIDAALISVDQPIFGFDITVKTSVSYTLKDQVGAVVWQEVISEPYTANFSDALIGVERLRLANEGSAKQNIKLAIERLVAAGVVAPPATS